MPAPKINHRLEAAIALIKNGSPVSRALRAAGYSPKTAIRSASQRSEITNGKLRGAQKEFIERFSARAESIGLTPEFSATSLKQIADSPKNLDKISAIREFDNVMLKSMLIGLHRAKIAAPNSALNLFILPSTMSQSEDWKLSAIEAQRIESENAAELAQTIPTPKPKPVHERYRKLRANKRKP